MIDVEELLIDEITKELESYPNIIVLSSELVTLPQLPCVCVNEIDNRLCAKGIDTSDTEQYAEVTYQIDVYSNKGDYKKKEVKEIYNRLDKLMFRLGFYRRGKNAIEFGENRVCRMSGRYSGTVSCKKQTIRR